MLVSAVLGAFQIYQRIGQVCLFFNRCLLCTIDISGLDACIDVIHGQL